MSSISEESKEEENEKDTNEKIININILDKNYLKSKMIKIKEEIKDYVIDKYINIIYKQNKEIEKIKKDYNELLINTSNILKIVINNKILIKDEKEKIKKSSIFKIIDNYDSNNNKNNNKNFNTDRSTFKNINNKNIKVNPIHNGKNKTFYKNNKSIEMNKEQIININKRKKSSSKINNSNVDNLIFSKSNRNFRTNIDINDKENKENINNNTNIRLKNHINHINIDYLRELNNKDLQKIKYIKQKLLDTTINKIFLNNDIEINYNPKKNKVNNNRNRIYVFRKDLFKNKKYNHSFNTPRKIKEIINKKNKIYHASSSSSFNIKKGIKSENIIKNNQIDNNNSNSINEFIYSDRDEEQMEFNTYQERFFSHNNSFINNSNERNILIGSFNKKNENEGERNYSQLMYNPKFNSFLNRCEH